MKRDKTIVAVSVSVAVVAAAIAAIVVTNNRAAVARANATAAECQKDATNAWYKAVKAEAAAAAAKSAAAKADAEKAEADKIAVVAERDRAAEEAKIKAEAAAEAKAKAETAKAEAAAERERKEAERLKTEAARAELEKVRVKIAGDVKMSNDVAVAAMAKLETEKRKTESIIAEAKLKELRKIDFERIERELIEYKQELDERERALHPDVSIYDSSNVTWVAEREADVIGGETNRIRRAKSVLPENDLRLPPATRELARMDRLGQESRTNRVATSKARILGTLEGMRDAALHEGRVIDAQFFQKSIKSLYPEYQQ